MRLKLRTMLVIGCVSLLATSIPAFSIPAPQAQHQVGKKKAPQGTAAKHKPQANKRAARLPSSPIAAPPKQPLFGWPVLVREARKYMGTNPTARTRLWCATFMNMVLAKSGYSGTNSDAARSFAYYGHRINEPKIGAIAVLTRGKNGGHVGVVSGIDTHGNPIIISGNHGRRVGEAAYPRSRVIAYVMPSDRRLMGETQLAAAPNTSATTLSAASNNRTQPERTIDSPIHELLAAIEAERKRAEAKPRAVPASPVPRHAAVQPSTRIAPQTPQLRVQQVSRAITR